MRILRYIWKELSQLKWYESICIFLCIIRPVHLPNSDRVITVVDITIRGISYHIPYTLYDAYYYFCSRLLEFFLFYSLYKRTNNLVLLGLVMLGFGKIIAEATPEALYWRWTEYIWWLCVTIYLYFIWKKENK